MRETLRRRLAFTGSPSRLPDQGQVEVESVAGDLQLTHLRTPGTERPASATKDFFEPNDVVPVSGVYDVIDGRGRYLKSQVTCHEGWKFPPSRNHRAGSPYGYRLAYEAQHLQSPRKEPDRTIFRPGDIVPASGVYNVVDLEGGYLNCQRAFIENKRTRYGSLDGEPLEEKPHRFTETEGLDVADYGYMLEYKAAHLSHD